MSTIKSDSLKFYKYLCQKIGYEEVVRVRRLITTITDMASQRVKTILSGSVGEGLDLKDSDVDIMEIDSSFKVYESEKDVVFESNTIPLILNTEESQSCFAQLCLPKKCNVNDCGRNMFQKHHLGLVLSSERYVQEYLLIFPLTHPKIHGPCVSDKNDQIDLAHCIQCNKWIFQAQPWVRRPRST